MSSMANFDDPTKAPEAQQRDELTIFKFAYKANLDIDGLPQVLPSDITSPIIQLKIGNEHTGKYLDLHAHESVLCKLPFFRAALQGPFKESTTKIVKMPEDDPEVVTSLVEFLYRDDYNDLGSPSADTKEKETRVIDKQLQGRKGEIESNGLTDIEIKFWRKWYHARVYALAEKYGCEGLCKCAGEKISAMPITVDEKTVGLFMEYLLMVYEITGPGSKLRLSTAPDCVIKYDVRECARVIGSAWKDAEEGEHLDAAFAKCPEIAVDMVRAISGSLVELANDAVDLTKENHWCLTPRYNGGVTGNPYAGAGETIF